jgi:hypothetical protein
VLLYSVALPLSPVSSWFWTVPVSKPHKFFHVSNTMPSLCFVLQRNKQK